MALPSNRNSDAAEAIDRLILVARRQYRQGRMTAATDLLRELAARHPGDPHPPLALAGIMIDADQFQEALTVLETVPEGSGKEQREFMAACLTALEAPEAAGAVNKLLDDHPGSSRALHLRGVLAARQGDIPEAEKRLRQAAAADPAYGEPLVHLGVLYCEAGRLDPGLDLIEDGFLRSPESTTAVIRYHEAVCRLQAWERAEAAFAEALAKCPESRRIRFLHIDILLRRNKPDAAMKAVEAALAILGPEDGLLDAALNLRRRFPPNEAPAGGGRRPLISLCMIVRDEQEHLARCLASAEAVADETIVVDTGSADRTMDVARVFGARVFQFPWDRDFSTARNFSLQQASGDWILVLDADEAIGTGDAERLRELVGRASPGAVAFSMVTRNYMHQYNVLGWQPNDGRYGGQEAGNGWFASEKVRLFPNRPEVRFCYPVHEIVEPSLKRAGIAVRSCPVPVHHYGKLDIRRSALKGAAYFEIGLKKIDTLVRDPRALRELAVQAMSLERFADAVDLWRRVAAAEPANALALVNLGSAHWRLGQYEKAEDCARKAAKIAPEVKEAWLNLANALLHLGQVGQAAAILADTLRRHPDYLAARFLSAAALSCQGLEGRGASALAALRSTPLGPGLALSCETLMESLSAAGQELPARRLADAANAAGCTAMPSDPALSPADRVS